MQMRTDSSETDFSESKERAGELGVVIKVPASSLANQDGIIAKDVVSPAGKVLLPAGVDVVLLESSLEHIVHKLLKHGVEWVYLRTRPTFSDKDIDNLISNVFKDGDSLVKKQQAREVITSVGNLFNAVHEQGFNSDLVTPLANMGDSLAAEIVKNPSVAFSLAKVQHADEYTFVHSFNVSVLSGFLATKVHPGNTEFLQKVVVGSLLHDIGKAHIPVEILNKPGRLTFAEFEEMKKHPQLGVTMAIGAGITDQDILGVIGGHHEKWSGEGYPKHRKGFEISEAARVVAVADVFDALTAQRVYKDPMSSRDAITLIIKDAGVHFDMTVARELLLSLGLYPPGSIVSLSDGSIGLVVSGGGRDLIRPVIMVRSGAKDKSTAAPPAFVDLRTSPVYITNYLGSAPKRNVMSPPENDKKEKRKKEKPQKIAQKK